jgi:small-conductance mechanosensitive channel
MDIQTVIAYEFLGNSIFRWGAALVLALITFGVLRIVRRIVRGRLNHLAKRTSIYVDDLITGLLGDTRSFFFYGLSIYVGSSLLEFSERPSKLILQGISLLLLAQIFVWGNYAIQKSIEHYSAHEDSSSSTKTTLSAMNFLARLVLYSLLILFALDNLGINITTLVAGLGVTSIAVALAVQNILGDLFSSLSIVLDKPFEIGDFVVVGEFSGTVENIGLRSTRLRSLRGSNWFLLIMIC